MPRYALDDPRLDEAIAEMAARDVAAWPPVTELERAKVAPLLAPPATEQPTVRQRRKSPIRTTPVRRAA